jgi:hypothetical protein
LISDLELLCGTDFDPRQVHPDVARFYTRTAEYDIDAWAEWSGIFRPFGRALAGLFSRRLQQLNVPLSALDTSHGMTSDIVQLVDRRTSEVRLTAWVRRLHRTGDVLYAGSYSVCFLPGEQRSCVRVAFPLPNGNAMVLMRPISHADGSMTVVSNGRRFGDAGFYFTVHHGRKVWARYLRSLRESIHVFAAPDADVRADHVLTLWGLTFLRLHYRLRRRAAADASPRLASTPP